MSKILYLDYNSTTPVDPQVLESMLPYFTEKFGNASSKTHAYGWIAQEAVDIAREHVAALIGAEKNEIVFTSGATESINLALKGVFEAYKKKGNHIITLATEHKAVLDSCKHLEDLGAKITYLPVLENGLINLDLLKETITDKTILFCGMLANNETGVILPMKEIADIVHEKNCMLVSDTTQACGKIDVDVNELGIDILTMSAHKMYGPKGCGVLYMRRRSPRVYITAQQDGGGHENGKRSGTLNVPGIVGMGKACEIIKGILPEESKRLNILREKLERGILTIGNASIHGFKSVRLPNTSNIAFHGIKADGLIKKLNKMALATGSACTSAIPEPSHVLKAMGVSNEDALSSIRISLGRFSTEEEISFALTALEKSIRI